MTEGKVKFAEHLRLTHFTMVAVAATLLLVVWGINFDYIKEELRVINNILYAFVTESEGAEALDDGLLEKYVRNELGEKKVINGNIGINIKNNALSVNTLLVSASLPYATVFHSETQNEIRGWMGENVQYSDFYKGGRPHTHYVKHSERDDEISLIASYGFWNELATNPKTVGVFESFWNMCAKTRHSYIFRNIEKVHLYKVVDKNEPGAIQFVLEYATKHWHKKTSKTKIYIKKIEFEWDKIASNQYRYDPNEIGASVAQFEHNDLGAAVGDEDISRIAFAFFKSDGNSFHQVYIKRNVSHGDYLIVIYAKYYHEPLYIQEKILNRVDDTTRKIGMFKDSFPEVYKYSRNYYSLNSMSFEWLLSNIEREEKKLNAQIEIAGIKIPGNSIKILGAMIMFIIQLYFYLHLKVFVNKISTSIKLNNIAWIGIYPEKLSRIVFIISCLLLPLSVPVVVLINDTSDNYNWIVCGLSFFITIATYRYVRAVHKIVCQAA